MTKKALVSNIERDGKDQLGYRIIEVVDVNNTFEVHPDLTWKDCDDFVEGEGKYYYDATTNSFKKNPGAVPHPSGEQLSEDDPTEYVWDWDSESWSLVVNN